MTESGISSLLGGLEIGVFRLSVTSDQRMIPVTGVTSDIWMLEDVEHYAVQFEESPGETLA